MYSHVFELSPCRSVFQTRRHKSKSSLKNNLSTPSSELNSYTATNNISCYLLDAIGPEIAALGDSVTCLQVRANCARFFCNTLTNANPRIFFRLAKFDIRWSIERWLFVFKELRAQLERRDNDFGILNLVGGGDGDDEGGFIVDRLDTAIRSSSTALEWYIKGMEILISTHRLSICEDW
jgi:hypothetical protein